MKSKRTDSTRLVENSLPLGMLCRVCNLRSVGVRECYCCGDLWLVCDGCEAAHGRLASAS